MQFEIKKSVQFSLTYKQKWIGYSSMSGTLDKVGDSGEIPLNISSLEISEPDAVIQVTTPDMDVTVDPTNPRDRKVDLSKSKEADAIRSLSGVAQSVVARKIHTLCDGFGVSMVVLLRWIRAEKKVGSEYTANELVDEYAEQVMISSEKALSNEATSSSSNLLQAQRQVVKTIEGIADKVLNPINTILFNNHNQA